MIGSMQVGVAANDATMHTLQSAAVLLEFGAALFIASLFAIAGRAPQRRGYFDTWTVAWRFASLALAALAARYFLLQGDSWLIGALYWVYICAKLAYWIFVWRGVVEYTSAQAASHHRWLATTAFAVGSGGFLLAGNLNNLIVVQAPVAVACCMAAAITLVRSGRSRHQAGRFTAATVLSVTTVLWGVYFVAFGTVMNLVPALPGTLTELVFRFNSYADTLMLVALGYAMLMIFMEDARERILNAESRLSSLVTSAPDPILTIDGAQRVIESNAAAAQVLGTSRSGMDVTTFVAPGDRERVRLAIQQFAQGDELTQVVGDTERLHALRPDGSQFPAEFTISRLHDADLSSVSLVVRDLTSRYEREERRRQTSTMEAVRQLAGGLAHDFNNLLTTIVGRSQIVARTLPASSPVRDDVQQIERAASAAARLSQGLLALSRREPLDPERQSVDEIVEDCTRLMATSPDSGITITVRPGSSDARAHVDRKRLESALSSIIRNAVEAVGEGGAITIETSRTLLPHHGGATSEAVGISVRDTGPGLTADARAHLFEPFFSTKGEGRGLGLATTWAFVHQSGGTLDVDSGPQGTTVRMFFPVAAEQPGDRVRGPAPSLTIVADARRTNRTVLLAEDEPSVRRSVRVFLERAGFAVVDAADGVEALAAFERAPDEFGLLLTDVMMPQMGGRELTTRLLELRPDLRVVFMSGFLRDPEVLRMVNDRRVRFIAKPFDVDALVGIVRAELSEAGANVA